MHLSYIKQNRKIEKLKVAQKILHEVKIHLFKKIKVLFHSLVYEVMKYSFSINQAHHVVHGFAWPAACPWA